MNIQRTINLTPIFGVNEPLFEFTFLAAPFGELTPAGRFEEMTAYIRRTLMDHYHFGLMDDHTFIVEFYPAHEPRFRRQRTFGRIGSLTSEIFLGIYEGMLQSDETLILDGMRITVQLIGGGMNYQIYGSGCTHGARALPSHLKGRGLITHVWAEEKKSILEETGLCGILACLLLKNKDYLLKSQFHDWIIAAKRIGLQLGITDGICNNDHFKQLLQLPGWEEHRIIVFSINRTIEFMHSGDKWYSSINIGNH